MKSDRIYLDVETYKDYFLASFLRESTGNILDIEFHADQPLNKKKLAAVMGKNQTISFNGNGYDLIIITAALMGYSNEKLKALSDNIIKSNLPSWRIAKDHEIYVPRMWDHIDIMDVAPGTASLKIYGGRLGAPKLQDLPIKPDDNITPELREPMRRYCHNDLYTTQLLCNKLIKQIELRESMSEQYGVDLRSKGGAQVAKAVLKSILESKGVKVPSNQVASPKKIRFNNPGFISFETEKLKAVFNDVLLCDFELSVNGQVKLPVAINKAIEFEGAKYKFGIGGLHSQESAQAVIKPESGLLFEKDVASMYPNIILNQKLFPKHLGALFCSVYSGIVERRLQAKRAGDKSTSDSLKLVINSSFGLFGSKYAFLYSPDLLIQTTLTGQLALLMLIEKITLAGAKVVSANTDGVVVLCDNDKVYQSVEAVSFDWEMTTGLELEETRYKAIYSQSVNNYFSVCDNDSVKGKGCFSDGGLAKNPDKTICYKAVIEFLKSGRHMMETLMECQDIKQFVKVRQVNGGAVWRGAEVGKAVRFYYSKEVGEDECLRYVTNGNKVPQSDGAKPLMNLPEELPCDIDYKRYLNESQKILESLGV